VGTVHLQPLTIHITVGSLQHTVTI
jgi:hypothetical protein